MKKLMFILLILFSLVSNAQRKGLKKLIPNQYHAQFAGSVGAGSIGFGYANQSDNLNLSFAYGYVPASLGGKLDILSTRFTFKPFTQKLGDKAIWRPINPLVFISYTINEGFYGNWPEEQYPKDYYWWNSAYRLHAGLNSEISVQASQNNKYIKSYTFFAEVNTNDLYLTSYLSNRNYLTIYDIFKLGFGLKVNIN